MVVVCAFVLGVVAKCYGCIEGQSECVHQSRSFRT